MKRNDFLNTLSGGLILVCAGSCMVSCSTGDDGAEGTPRPPTPNPVAGTKVSVVLSSMPNVGDQIKSNSVLFFRIAEEDIAGSFIATEAICPHQGGALVWRVNDNRIQCQLHSATYNTSGNVLQGPQNSAGSTRMLKIYAKTVENGNLIATVG
tara:strand:+ start:32923 stop:33381 length:459 start_codon:yes stop_codon:yes gene_type:complete